MPWPGRGLATTARRDHIAARIQHHDGFNSDFDSGLQQLVMAAQGYLGKVELG